MSDPMPGNPKISSSAWTVFILMKRPESALREQFKPPRCPSWVGSILAENPQPRFLIFQSNG